jgi:hypothetical protein
MRCHQYERSGSNGCKCNDDPHGHEKFPFDTSTLTARLGIPYRDGEAGAGGALLASTNGSHHLPDTAPGRKPR